MKERARVDFNEDPYLRDVVERNLEIAAQCCIDISHRIISLEGAQKPVHYYDALLRMGELGVVSPDFARQLAPRAGFRNVLVHEDVAIDWDEVYRALGHLQDSARFADSVRWWLSERTASDDRPIP